MRYAVTVEPADRNAHPDAAAVDSIIDADGKDAALEKAEAAYRRRYRSVAKLKTSIVRLRPGRAR